MIRRLAIVGTPAAIAVLLLASCAPGTGTAQEPQSSPSPTPVPGASVVVRVSGAPLSSLALTPGSLTPSFAATTTDYYVRCAAGVNSLSLNLSGAGGKSLTLEKTKGNQVSTQLNLQENDLVLVAATNSSTHKVSNYWIRCLPHDFPALRIDVPDTSSDGYYLTGTLTGSSNGKASSTYAFILDRNAVPVWYLRTDGVANLELLPDGKLAWATAKGPVGVDPNAGYTLYDPSSGKATLLKAPTPPTDEHELLQLANGDRFLISSPLKTGVDMSGFKSSYDAANGTIVDCVVQEVDAQGNLLWQWRASDHIGLGEAVPNVAGLIDYNNRKVADLFHCNSVDVDPDTGDVLVSLRNADAVYLINKQSGRVMWKLGGSRSVQDGEQVLSLHGDAESGFAGQHDARFQPGTSGSKSVVSLYDDHTAKSGSARAVEYTIDSNAGTATLDWEYRAPDGTNAQATGSFRRYASGADNLVGWGFKPGSGFTEADAAGNVIFQVSCPNGEFEYRVLKVAASALDVNKLRAHTQVLLTQ